MYDKRQNILIKRSIGLSKFAKTTPLFNCLKIESIRELYLKHKIFLLKQLNKNEFTSSVLKKLRYFNTNKIIKFSNDSIINQITIVNKMANIDDCTINLSLSIQKIIEQFLCSNIGLLDSINFILNIFFLDNKIQEKVKLLANLLDYTNYT